MAIVNKVNQKAVNCAEARSIGPPIKQTIGISGLRVLAKGDSDWPCLFTTFKFRANLPGVAWNDDDSQSHA